MKLLMVIVNEEYQKLISSIFEQRECNATIIASTGDFLQYGDTIFLSGVDENMADDLIEEIRKKMETVSRGYVDKKKSMEEQSTDVSVFCLDIVEYIKCGGKMPYDSNKVESTEFSIEESIR